MALEAAAVLLVALVALALAAADWRPSASPARSLSPPLALHPLALVAEELLEALADRKVHRRLPRLLGVVVVVRVRSKSWLVSFAST